MIKTHTAFKRTVVACFIGFLIQGILNNFVPLLFVTFQKSYSLSLDKITMLITLNFGTQIIVDFLCTKFIDAVGYKNSAIIAHIFSAGGFISLAVLPEIMSNSYIGIIISVILYAIGSGIIEVALSPILEACPIKRKSAVMSLMHSFYCWGHLFTILASTAFFAFFGIDKWRYITLIWAAIPILNLILFIFSPVVSLNEQGNRIGIRSLIKLKTFWVLIVLMVCAGASEQCMSQWISAFAESGLGFNKTTGDLIGTCLFAMFMGLSRVFYGRNSDKINLIRFIKYSAVCCAICYLVAVLSHNAIISLIGCVLTGFTVGILWPGTYSTAIIAIPTGGTSLFALLALAGDFGCTSGPGYLGVISSIFSDNLKIGILFSIIFPITIIFFIGKLKNK